MEASRHGGVSHGRPTWALWLGDGGEEGHEAGVAEELSNEDGGVALRLGTINPLQWAVRICVRHEGGGSGACGVICLCGRMVRWVWMERGV
jgi:hypothetical protein